MYTYDPDDYYEHMLSSIADDFCSTEVFFYYFFFNLWLGFI